MNNNINNDNSSNNPSTGDIIANLDNYDFDVDEIIRQGMSKLNASPTADFEKDVLSTMPADMQNTFNSIYGEDFFKNQQVKEEQSQVQAQQGQNAQQQPLYQNYSDRSKNYKYKTFYGGTPNSIDTVDMRSMGLKGQIWSGNSVPYIKKEYAEAVHELDDQLTANGVKFIYTSAMGGQHQRSASGKGHGDAAKLDGQGIIPPSLYRKLYNDGWFGAGTGAIGYEYGGKKTVTTPEEYEKLYKAGKVTMANGAHYDLSQKSRSERMAQSRTKDNGNFAVAFADNNKSQPSTPNKRLPVDDVIAFVDAQNEANKIQRPKSSMEQPSINLYENAVNNVRRIGTAMTSLWVNGPELLANAPLAIQNYAAKYNYNMDDVVGNAVVDIGNALLSTYNIDLRKLQGRNPVDVLKGAIAGAYANPVDFLFDVISLGGAGVARKLIGKTPYLAQMVNAGKVESAIATERATLAQKGLKAEEKLSEINKLADEAGISREQLFKAAEEGKDILPKGEKTEQLWNKLKSASDDFDELNRVYKPESHVGKERTAITQKILRDRQLEQPAITFEQVRREITPYLDKMDKSGKDALLKKSSKGDKLAKEVYEAKNLFDDNKIMPITHMLAEVDKSVGKAAVEAAKLTDDYVRAGRFTTRMYGNAKYADIAKQWSKPQEYITNLMDSYLEGGIASAILKGEFSPIAEGVKKASKASYLDRQLLEQGKLREALKNARKEPLNLDDIAIDNDMLAPLKSQIDISGGAYGGIIKDVASTVKGVMLSTGQYLGPNAITGITNAVLTSGPMVIADIVSAIKSKGRLAKNLGVYRYDRPAKISNRPVLNWINKLNNTWGGRQMRRLDRGIQNTLAEVAAHGEMRRANIPFKDRFKDVSQFDKAKLGEMITDIKRTALINSPKTLLPDTITDIASIFNPFWRWQDTATQATYNMLRKNPIMSNFLLQDILGSIAFDKEMQDRLNLNVDLDKPYVTFKQDANTGQMKTITAEFIPLTTTIKIADIDQMKERPVSFSILDPIINSMNGLDRYGRPIKRPDTADIINQISGTKRFEKRQGQGWQEIKGGKGDEVLNTAIKSLIGPVNFYNRTVAPLLAPIVSPTGQFYQPYGNSVFGSHYRDINPSIIQSANPTQGRTAGDVLRAFGGIYEQEYHPEWDRISPLQQQNLTRDYLRGQIRLNRQGY